MAILILEHQGKRRGGVLNGRISIGRQPGSHVVIEDESVSRVHAWIGRVGHTYFLTDGGSRTGTLVNGRPVAGRRTLHDGDEILIGPARMFFHADAPLPPEIEPLSTVDESAPISAESSDAVNIQVRDVTADDPARPARAETAMQDTTCGACQSSIDSSEPTTSCPECGVSFHANCWIENRGCSSYGCKQVGILDPAATARFAPVEAASVAAHELSENPRRVQWSYVLLPVSGLAGLAGMFAFGVPSLGLLIGLILYGMHRPRRGQWALAGSEIFSAIAAAAGAAFSTYWWLLPAAGVMHR